MNELKLKNSLHGKSSITPSNKMKQQFSQESKGFFKCPRCKQKAMILTFTTALMAVFIIIRSPNPYEKVDVATFINKQIELSAQLDDALLDSSLSYVEFEPILDDNSTL